ncbi:MAG: DUF998 domain-containing protein [Candidatus Helarchaeota archaeon]
MEWNPLKWPLSVLSGVLMIVFFFIFTLTAVALFPPFNINLGPFDFWAMGPYNIVTNYLSDLGNYIFNPRGADFFNYGMIIVGIMIFLFFIGIMKFIEQNEHQTLVKIIRFLGFAAAIALIMIGTFSENAPTPLHELWSLLFFT